MSYEKVVVVTRKTRLAGLIERFNSRGQAKFYIEHSGGDFSDYEREDSTYRRSLDAIRKGVEVGLKVQVMDREIVPTYLFTNEDLVVTAGQDGLVANTAKYVGAQPIVGVNPDPERFDGILLPFRPDRTRDAVRHALDGTARVRGVTLAQASLADAQRLLAFNDFFLGARSHVSARYRLNGEPQSSSGVIVSTGAGSTGWLSSVFNMVAAIARAPVPPVRMPWEDPRLVFVVREPFASRHSRADTVTGWIEPDGALRIESQMPTGGVIFSDGVEADFLDFNSGAVATISAAPQKAQLVVGPQ